MNRNPKRRSRPCVCGTQLRCADFPSQTSRAQGDGQHAEVATARSGQFAAPARLPQLSSRSYVVLAGRVSFVKGSAALCKIRSEFALMLHPKVCESERQHT